MISYEDANKLLVDVDGGVVAFTHIFKSLGSYLTIDLSDATEEEEKMKSASAAFASLRLVQIQRCQAATQSQNL